MVVECRSNEFIGSYRTVTVVSSQWYDYRHRLRGDGAGIGIQSDTRRAPVALGDFGG
jgi:hypothetical protein